MSCTKVYVVLLALSGLMACSSNIHAAITVDGSLSDWGISLNAQQHLVYDAGYGYQYSSTQNIEKSGQTTINGRTVMYDLEDSNDNSNSYKVGPLYGGQNYDAEALVVSIVGSDLYIGIATGQRPDNGTKAFAPGDICISKGTDVWGIEVGGQTHTSEIVDGDKGITYKLDASGATLSSTQLNSQTAGSIWKGGYWNLGIDGSGNVKTQLNTGGTYGGTYLGMSDYVYRFDSAYGQHAFIELCIPNYQELLGNNLDGATIRWAPVCGNDQLDLCVILPSNGPPGAVPEPAGVLIWTVLSLTAVCFARKNRSPHSQP